MKPALLALITGSLAFAQSFTGTLNPADANDVFLVKFTLSSATTVRVQSWGYGGSASAPGGTNAAGTVIAPGGLDPYISLFSGTGINATFLASNDDGLCPPGTQVSGFCLDPTLTIDLPAGSYTLALSVFENFSFAENLGAGAIGDLFISLGNYYDPYSNTLRTPRYAFDLSGNGLSVIGTGRLVEPPTLGKTFGNATILVNGSTTLTFTAANSALTPLTGVGFTDPLPVGLVIDTPATTTVCGGTLTTTAGSVSLANATLAALSNCQFSVTVRGTTTGTKNNLTSAITSIEGDAGLPATANIDVQLQPQITSQPSNQTVCAGSTATFAAAASGTPIPAVQWQVSVASGPFTNVAGATTATFAIVTTAALNGNQYRAVFTSAAGTATTTPATLTVNTPPTVTLSPVSQTVTTGNQVTFTTAASSQPAATVQWQRSIDGGATFTDIPGATSLSLNFNAADGDDNNRYRAVFTNTCGFTATAAAVLTVNVPPQITLQPGNQTVCAGTTATFIAAASGRPVPAVQWQVSIGGGPFANIPGATNATLNSTGTTAGMNGNRYQAVFTNSVGTVTTNSVLLTVNTAPVITLSPLDQTINEGQLVTFTATATGQPAPTVQWEVSVNGGPFVAIPGATANTFTFTAAQALTKNRYRAVFTNLCGITTTDPAIFSNIPFDVFQIRYASNLNQGDSVVNISNTGVNGASLNGPGFGGAGNICVNAYTFSPDEQLISCCSCLLTPNALASLSVSGDLISNTLTGVRPNSVVIKLVASGADFTGTSCTNSAALVNTPGFQLAPGLVAYGTTIHPPAITETPFLRGTLNLQELASIKNRCTNIVGNGSTFGICRSCRAGGLNGAK